jgi:hypothetical protein
LVHIRTGKRRGLAAVVLAGFFVTSCHGDGPARSLSVYRDCNERLGPVIASLEDLRSRVIRPIVLEKYRLAVQDVQLHYRAFDPRDVDTECLRLVGTEAEGALELYAEALDRWAECAGDRFCRPELLKVVLELHWVTASERVDKAEAALRGLRP